MILSTSPPRQGQTPFALLDLKRASLASDLIYDIVLDIVAPTSPRNIELGQWIWNDRSCSNVLTQFRITGNFMVDLTLQAADGSTVMRASRAVSNTSLLETSQH